MKSVKGLLALAAGVGSVLAPGLAAGAADDQAGVERELMRLENGAMERWRQGDPMGWGEIAAPEVTYVDPGLTKPIVGHAEYLRYLEKLKGQISYDGSEFLNPKVAVYGDLAVLTYNYQATTRQADGSVKRHAPWNTTEVYARLDGGWKIIHTHWSYVHDVLPDELEIPLPVELEERTEEGVAGEVMSVERAATRRWRQGDPAGFLEICAPEITSFDPETPRRLDGLDNLRGEYEKLAGAIHFDVMEFVQPIVQVHGDTAVLFSRFLATRLRSDGSIQRRTPWNRTKVYVKRGGAWRIVHAHFSFIGGRPPAGSVPEP